MFFHLVRLRSVRRQLGRDVSARLVSVLVLLRLDYCNAVLVGLPAATLAPLQSPACGDKIRARPETTRPCNSRSSGVALAPCCANLVHGIAYRQN